MWTDRRMDRKMDKKWTNGQTDIITPISKEPSYDGDLCPCQV